MSAFLSWAIKNLSNIFSLIGILLTLYFGIYYVPNWLRETQSEKIRNSKINLEQSIKELVYSDLPCNFKEIETIIEAKEIDLNEKFPLTAEQVLTVTQESFMQDKFLPLEIRKGLIEEIENLKNEIPPAVKAIEHKNEIVSSTIIYEWMSIILSSVGVLFGIISYFIRFRTEKEKQEEIDNQIAKNEEYNDIIDNAMDFENSISNEIRNIEGVKILRDSSDRDFGFDLEFLFNNKHHYVEIKYFRESKVGLGSFRQFLSKLKGMEGEFWFVYNTDLTDLVKREALETKNRKIKYIYARDPESFRETIKNILNGNINSNT